MTRTQRSQPSGRGKTTSNAIQRQSQVSRSLSKVLRHQAENERIPIAKDGWVKLSDLLSWRGLSDPGKFSPPVTIGEIMDVVKEDGMHGKGRFGLKLATTQEAIESREEFTEKVTQVTSDAHNLSMNEQQQVKNPESKNSPETLSVISYQAEHPDTPASAYLIRATQGHSIKAVESEGLLTPITLDDPSSIPETVVHGTFYGAWSGIQSTGGLKPMSRNMIHFASGPHLKEVVPNDSDTGIPTEPTLKSKKQVDEVLSANKVISGMRWDAQILIYIDIKRLLEDTRDKKWDMKWWRSDNGVILSEGLPRTLFVDDTRTEKAQPETSIEGGPQIGSPADAEVNERRENAKQVKTISAQGTGSDRIVPMAYFNAVVEIKAGVGLLYRADKGVVQDLPDHLKSKGVPRGKGPRPARNRAGEGTPRARVERDNDLSAQIEQGYD